MGVEDLVHPILLFHDRVAEVPDALLRYVSLRRPTVGKLSRRKRAHAVLTSSVTLLGRGLRGLQYARARMDPRR